MKRLTVFGLIILMGWQVLSACTSVIISGKRTASGRPVMMKNRDTGELRNDVRYYQGEKYRFIGICNSPVEGGEVWTGTNETGFSIMNTASYNIKNDNISYDDMDMEGVLMYQALAVCRTVDEFEQFLRNHKKPLLVEANFGVIDAQGGAAYFECNNYEWVRYNVDDEPSGYKVVTNFSFAGRYEERLGWERYLTASATMEDLDRQYRGTTLPIDHAWLLRHFSRSYRHELLGLPEDYTTKSGIAVDQDFIPRRITSCAVIVEGVRPGEDPLHTVMWTLLGYPASAVAVPLMVGTENCLPKEVLPDEGNSAYCRLSLRLKKEHIFTYSLSNGKYYFNIGVIQQGLYDKPAMRVCAEKAESEIDQLFAAIYTDWVDGQISNEQFWAAYREQTPIYWQTYLQHFNPYL